MQRPMRFIVLLLVVAGCSDDPTPMDSGFDWFDGGANDSATGDTGTDASRDSGATDVGATDSGLADGNAGDVGLSDAGPISDAGDDAGTADSGLPSCVDLEVNRTGLSVAMGSTVGAGNDFGSALCEGLGPDVAILFVAPSAGSFVFDTDGSDFDTILSAHRPECGANTELFCADDTGSELYSTISATLGEGESLLINLDGLGGEDQGDYVLNVTQLADTCPSMDLGSAVGAAVAAAQVIDETTLDNRTGSCGYGGGGGDLTYTWTAPAAGDYTFATKNATLDTVLYLLEESCSGDEFACNDDSVVPDEDSAITIALESGQAIVIVVDAFTSTETGTFNLNISGPV